MIPRLDAALMIELGDEVCSALMTAEDWREVLRRYVAQQEALDASS